LLNSELKSSFLICLHVVRFYVTQLYPVSKTLHYLKG
jgi:hypothetical protein